MKNILKLTLLILSSLQTIVAQLPVTDVTTNANLIKSNVLATENIAKNAAILAKAKNTYETLSKMKSTYDKWNQNIETVRGTIETGREVKNISSTLTKVKDSFKQGMNIVNNNSFLSQNDHQKIIYVYQKILMDCIEITSESIDYVTNGTFKMNDAERLGFLKMYHVKLEKKVNLIQYMNKKLIYANNQTRVLKKQNEFFKNSTPTYKK